jgi:hypothetical protein
MRIFVPPFGARVQRFALVVLLLLAAISFSRMRTSDWLLMSGWLSLILGLSLARTLPDRLEQALARLADRGVLVVTPDQLDRFCQDLEDSIVRRWAPGFGAVCALSLVPAWAFAVGGNLLLALPELFAEMVGGYIAGCYIGRAARYGALGAALESRGVALRVMVGHLDGVGGLKPVGEFYFYQAMLVAIPAVFLAVWLVLFTLPHLHAMYHHWQAPYAGLLPLMITFEVLAFVVPLWWFHRAMMGQKSELLREADQLSPRIAEIQRKLGEGGHPEEAGALEETLAHMTARVQAIEELPVWPVDPRTKRRFGVGNLVLLIPVVSNLTGLSTQWQEFLTAVFKKTLAD